MNPYYYDELPVMVDDEFMMAFAVAFLGILAVLLLIAAIFWVIRSMSLHAIARRRGIRNAWLSWLPIGNGWVLGSISDQYQHLALGQIKSRRKILLALNLVSVLSTVGSIATSVAAAVAQSESYEAGLTMSLVGMIPSLLTTVLGIAALVFYHMCNYDLYRSCDPKNAVAYLVIGIFIPVTEPFFYLVNRRKDAGMPLRTAEPDCMIEH